MKNRLLLVLVLLTTVAWAQETPEAGIQRLTNELNTLVQNKKDSLQITLTDLENREKSGAITADEAATLRKEANEAYATVLDDIIYEKVDEIWAKKYEIDEAVYGVEEETEEVFAPEQEEMTDSTDTNKLSQFGGKIPQIGKAEKFKTNGHFAFGFNNMIYDHQLNTLDDSPYSLRASVFFEIGFNKSIPFKKEGTSPLFKYGLSFRYSEMKLFDNLYHEDLGDLTVLSVHPEELKKSKLTTSQMLIPLELEFNLTRKSEDELKKGFKLGIGGYAGLNYFTKEVIKFEESSEQRKQENYGSFNVSPFVYGLSGYLGYNNYALFVKYDLNTFFRESNTRAISAGLRLGL